MKIVAYTRISTDKQDLEKQKHLLYEYAHHNKFVIDEIIQAEVSSSKSKKERKIDLLLDQLKAGDMLLVTELSRLGRNMLETLNIINELSSNKIKVVFARQPELSTISSHQKLLLAIYSYFAEAEREYISLRTKQGLAAVKAQGKKLGRPKGSKNKKSRVLDPFKDQIKEYLDMKLPLGSIVKIINKQLEKEITYPAFKYFIQHDEQLKNLIQFRKNKGKV